MRATNLQALLISGYLNSGYAPKLRCPTIKITDERHPEPPESRTDVRAAHSVHRLVRRHHRYINSYLFAFPSDEVIVSEYPLSKNLPLSLPAPSLIMKNAFVM